MNWHATIHRGLIPRRRPAPQLHRLSRVLVATDFSPRSECAVARATRLPMNHGAAMVLLHVLGVEEPARSREEAVATESLRRLAEQVRAAHRGLRLDVRLELRSGPLRKELTSAAERLDAELVVIGRPHRPASRWSAARARLLGGAADLVGAPLLMVAPGQTKAYARPMVCVKLERRSCRRMVEAALRLCPDAPALTVVHVADTSYDMVVHSTAGSARHALAVHDEALRRARESLRQLLSEIRTDGVRVEELVLTGAPAEGISRAAARLDADLVVVGRHLRGGVGRLVTSQVAAAVLATHCSDVLAVPVDAGP